EKEVQHQQVDDGADDGHGLEVQHAAHLLTKWSKSGFQPTKTMMSAVIKPKMAVPSAMAAPSSSVLVILPEASGWRAMASLAWAVAMPMPMPAPMPVRTAMPAAMIPISMRCFLLFCQMV